MTRTEDYFSELSDAQVRARDEWCGNLCSGWACEREPGHSGPHALRSSVGPAGWKAWTRKGEPIKNLDAYMAAVKKGGNMQYRCSKCGEKGHNARTCKGAGQNVTAVIPAASSAPEQDWKVGDEFNAYRLGSGEPFHEGPQTVSAVDPSPGLWASDGRYLFRFDTWRLEKVEKVPASSEAKSVRKITVWNLIDTVIPEARITLLYGPPGTGKTTAGSKAGNPDRVINVTLTEETPAAELRGHFVPKGDKFVWHHGPGVMAWVWEKGCRLVINEVDKASTDCLTFLYSLLDDESIAGFTLPNGEFVKPGPDFSVVATMNGTPEDLPDGLRDRFAAASIFVPKPHPDAVKSLPGDLQKPAQKGFDAGSLDGHAVSMRQWLSYASLREKVGESYAAMAVFGDSAEVVLNTLRIHGATKGVQK